MLLNPLSRHVASGYWTTVFIYADSQTDVCFSAVPRVFTMSAVLCVRSTLDDCGKFYDWYRTSLTVLWLRIGRGHVPGCICQHTIEKDNYNDAVIGAQDWVGLQTYKHIASWGSESDHSQKGALMVVFISLRKLASVWCADYDRRWNEVNLRSIWRTLP